MSLGKMLSQLVSWWMQFGRASVLPAIFLALAVPASGQQVEPRDLTELKLEELMDMEVVSASKHVQLSSQAPSSISVITREDIERFGYRTLADALRALTGFLISNDRNYSYIGVRGFSPPGDFNARVLVLIDGHRTNDNLYDGALVGNEFALDIRQIEKIEVVRGPSSSLYGSSAFFGIINVITRRRASFRSVEVSIDAGSPGAYDGSISLAGSPRKDLDVLLSASGTNIRGRHDLYFQEFDAVAENRGHAIDADDDTSTKVRSNISFKDLEFAAVYGTREKGIPTASYATIFNTHQTRTVDSLGFIDLSFAHPLEHGWELSARWGLNRYLYKGFYLYSTDDGGVYLNRDYTNGTWSSWEFQARNTIGKNFFTLGSEVRWNISQEQKNFNVRPLEMILDSSESSSNTGIFVQDEYQAFKWLTFHAGVRYDNYGSRGKSTSPRLGILLSPTKRLHSKLLYGRAFRVPNCYELFYEAPGQSSPRTELKPEYINTFELASDYALTPRIRLSASGYVYRIANLIVQLPDPVDGLNRYVNSGRVHSQGVEFEAELKTKSDLLATLGYTVQRTRDNNSGTTLPNSPAQMAKAKLSVPLGRRMAFLSLDGQYVGGRKTLQGGWIGGYGISNATITSRELKRHTSIALSAYNIFDKRFADPGAQEHRQPSLPQDGRELRLRFTYRF